MPLDTGTKKVTANIQRVESRDKLQPRSSNEPYWTLLSAGCYLGFRPSTLKSAAKGAGTWLARFNDTATGKRPGTTLGDFGHLSGSERYGAAKKAAEQWFQKLASGGSAESIDVAEACRRYAKGRDDAAARFERHVYGDPLARVPLDKLQPHHLQDWRKRLEAKPATLAKRKDGKNPTRERSVASTNRDMVPLRAALNHARDGGHIQTDMAWRVALRPAEANGRREVYLPIDERRALVGHMDVDIKPFYSALSRLPLRPGALALLRVKDFDARTGSLRVATDKAGGGRWIPLSNDVVELFTAQCRWRQGQPDAPIFHRADGKGWDKQTWKKPVKTAAQAAGLSANVVAYSLRHSVITDLVTGGLDLLTVALLSGTSVQMIQKHYGHLRHDHAREALAKLAL